MQDVDVGQKVLVKEAEVIAAMLSGGYVMACDGKALPPDTAVADANVLGRLSIATATHVGTDVVMSGLCGTTDRKGTLRWFRACDIEGATVMQGPVAVKGGKTEAPLMVSRIDVLPGDRIDIDMATFQVLRQKL